MSIIGLALNLLLAGLLVAALGMGWRLNRRLKALQESGQVAGGGGRGALYTLPESEGE